jgi:hypothetical protein
MNACAEPIDHQSPLSTLTMGKLQWGRRAGNVQIAAAYLRLAGTEVREGPANRHGNAACWSDFRHPAGANLNPVPDLVPMCDMRGAGAL